MKAQVLRFIKRNSNMLNSGVFIAYISVTMGLYVANYPDEFIYS